MQTIFSPKTVQIDRAIGVSELKRTLPREIFETCIVGEGVFKISFW